MIDGKLTVGMITNLSDSGLPQVNRDEFIKRHKEIKFNPEKCSNKTCCCNCANHHEIYSHPWVDHKPMNNLYRYICDARKYGMKNIIISNEHGECECWTKKARVK